MSERRTLFTGPNNIFAINIVNKKTIIHLKTAFCYEKCSQNIPVPYGSFLHHTLWFNGALYVGKFCCHSETRLNNPDMYLRSMDIQIRTILPSDNIAIAAIIRNTLAEFGANRPGTVYFDSSTDTLSEVFQASRSIYFVAFFQNTLIGGAGIFPSEGLPDDTCELVKMYLLPEARGKGIGKMLIDKCLEFAKDAGYKKVYLETLPELKKAIHVYEKFGFTYLPGPLGNTGHFGCDVWMMRGL